MLVLSQFPAFNLLNTALIVVMCCWHALVIGNAWSLQLVDLGDFLRSLLVWTGDRGQIQCVNWLILCEHIHFQMMVRLDRILSCISCHFNSTWRAKQTVIVAWRVPHQFGAGRVRWLDVEICGYAEKWTLNLIKVEVLHLLQRKIQKMALSLNQLSPLESFGVKNHMRWLVI